MTTFLRPVASSTAQMSETASALRMESYGLTPMEQRIVRHIAEGLSNKEIAQTCFLSEGTVKNYITEVLSKLQLRDRTQIAILYLKNQ